MSHITVQKQRRSEAGFTLVELAIVLVIIGLIVGGVLVGQDLIRAAEIRSTVSQLSAYDAAVNTFRNKYSGLPGDLASPATWPIAATNAGAANRADGDALIESGACTNANGYGGESALFWTHLSQTSLIAEGTTAITDYSAVAAIGTINATHMPFAKLGQGNKFHVTNVGGRNFYVVSNFTATTVTTCALAAADAMSPNTAFQIDDKLDDGNPTTGIVISVLDGAAPTAAGGGSATPNADGQTSTDDCYDSDAVPAYATTTDALGNELECQLRIRASF